MSRINNNTVSSLEVGRWQYCPTIRKMSIVIHLTMRDELHQAVLTAFSGCTSKPKYLEVVLLNMACL